MTYFILGFISLPLALFLYAFVTETQEERDYFR